MTALDDVISDWIVYIVGRPIVTMDVVMPTIVVESGSTSDSIASDCEDTKNGGHCNGELLGPAAALSSDHADTGEDSESEEVSRAAFLMLNLAELQVSSASHTRLVK